MMCGHLGFRLNPAGKCCYYNSRAVKVSYIILYDKSLSLIHIFLGVRRGKTGIQRHTVGTHERLGKIVALQAGDCGCTHNGFGLGPQQRCV